MYFSIVEILDAIKSRRLDTLFEIEEKVMSKTSLDRSLSELIDDPEFGTDEDKLRLFLIYYICAANLSNVSFSIELKRLEWFVPTYMNFIFILERN